MTTHNILLIIGAIIVLGLAGFFALNAYIYNEKQASPEEVAESYEPYRAELEGEFVCLPHTNTEGPQSMECAFGLLTDAGEYFAVDFSLMSQEATGIPVGERFRANGTVTPVERLSSDHWQRYPIEGIFSVTDSLEVL